jgi:2-oxoisovalerate dehydrogenase E1 component
MSTNRVAAVESAFDAWLESAAPAPRQLAPDEPLRPGSSLSARAAVELFEDQLASRALDVEARELKKSEPQLLHDRQRGPREQRRARRAALRRPIPCLLHYRSGAG